MDILTIKNLKELPVIDRQDVGEVLAFDDGGNLVKVETVDYTIEPLYETFNDLTGDGRWWANASEYGFDGFSSVEINASEYGNNKYTEGYNIGATEGYNVGREETVNNASELYVTNNGVYEGDLYKRVEVAVDVETPYNKGYEDGAKSASADAIVMDVTDNGIYCSKFAELPEWNEPLTGDDFYSYAYLKGIEFDTKYTWQTDTEIELWFMYDETFRPNQYYPPVIIGNTSYGSIRWNRDDNTNRTWEFYSASSTLFTLEPNVWNKIKLSITDGLWVNDEFIGKVVLNNVHIGKTIRISDSRGGSNWYFGMVKINGDIWYPTPFGFKNNNGDALIGDSSKIEYFKKQAPIIVDNLIKQVNVDVPIPLGSTKIRFTNSQFTKIPKVKSDGLTDMKEMFKGCGYVTDASALADLDTKYVTTLEGCFQSFGAADLDLSSISNWDVSNVTNLGSLFMSGNRFEDYSFMANWNTSNVANFQSIFYNSNGSSQIVRYIPIIKADSATILSMIFSNDTQPTTTLEYFGGFQNMKCNWNDNRGLSATPNLTYESCISILNCLYDFTGNGLTPSSSQGNLKVHQNFLDLVGDEINIGISKGWTITA